MDRQINYPITSYLKLSTKKLLSPSLAIPMCLAGF